MSPQLHSRTLFGQDSDMIVPTRQEPGESKTITLETAAKKKVKLVARTVPSWNQIAAWLGDLNQLRQGFVA